MPPDIPVKKPRRGAHAFTSATGGFHKQFDRIKIPHPVSTSSTRKPREAGLLTQVQLADQCTVPLYVGLPQIIQKAPALANHQKQAAAAMVILLVDLEVLVQVVDTFGKQRHLHFGGTGVALVAAIGLDDFSL
jgi:hypothetical protein